MGNNNSYNNNGYMGGMNPAGFQYQQNPNPPKYTQTLTKEQIAALRQNTDKFSLGLTQEEIWRGICFHRDDSGNPTLRENPDGTLTCSICGYTFDPTQDMTEEEIQASVNGIVDIMQTIKLLYLDMPVQAAQEYFQIIPLLEKAPKLFKLASDNFSRHEQWNNFRFNGTPNTINMYNMLNSIGGANQLWAQQQMNMNQGMMGGMQPNMMGNMNPMGQPMGMNPGMMGATGMMGQPIANGSNGLVNYNMMTQPQNNTGYQAGTPAGFQLNPTNTEVPQGAVQATSNVANQSPDGSKTEVNSTFKA